MRHARCGVALDALRAALHRLVNAAWRRKALDSRTLPIQVVALDGKVTALPTLNQPPFRRTTSRRSAWRTASCAR
jgi:hypothetical protein